MIFFNIQRLCLLRGIPEPFAYLRAHGFTHSQAHTIAAGRVKEIKTDHIEQLCRAFNCMPEELMDYKPTTRGIDPAHDVLAPLRKEPVKASSIQSLMASLPPAEIARLTAELEQRYRQPQSTAAGTEED